jgi:transposase
VADHVSGRGGLTDTGWQAMTPPFRPSMGRAVRGAATGRWSTACCGGYGRGAPWRDLPDRYGPWQTVHERCGRREREGTWSHLLAQIQARDDSGGAVEWTVSVDSTINRSHQHAAGARKMGADGNGGPVGPAHMAADQALGGSRGGPTTKVHVACDGRGLPLAVVLPPAPWCDGARWMG